MSDRKSIIAAIYETNRSATTFFAPMTLEAPPPWPDFHGFFFCGDKNDPEAPEDV